MRTLASRGLDGPRPHPLCHRQVCVPPHLLLNSQLLVVDLVVQNTKSDAFLCDCYSWYQLRSPGSTAVSCDGPAYRADGSTSRHRSEALNAT